MLAVGRAARPAPQVLDQARHHARPPRKVTKVDTLLDINTQERHPADGLKLNDIARIALNVQQPLAADAYDDIRATGAFILIDEVTHQTVAAGMIRLGE